MLPGRLLLAGAAIALVPLAAWLYSPDKPRPLLEAAYAQPPSVFLDVAGLRLHVRDTGPRDAPAVLLLHGFGSSLHTWEAWARPLSATRRVIRLDLPGFGLTGPDPTHDYADARTVAVLAALLDRLGVRTATLIGNSMGGRLAWRFAAEHPERTDRLVLVSPDGFAGPGAAYGERTGVPLMMRALPYVLPAAMLRMNVAPAYADPSRLDDTVVARYRDMLLAPGVRRAILDRTEQTILEDPAPLLARIQAPALLLWGEKDAMIPITNADDYLRLMPTARLVRLPTLGHVPQEEDPALSLQPVLAFLDGA